MEKITVPLAGRIREILGSPVAPLACFGALLFLPAVFNLSVYWRSNPLYGYGLWIPILAILLIWRRGATVPEHEPACFPGVGVFFIGLWVLLFPLVRAVQVANPDWRMLDGLLALGGVCAVLALAAHRGGLMFFTRWAVPVLFLLVSVPWSVRWERSFIAAAVSETAVAASAVLWLFGIPAVENGAMLYTLGGVVAVSEDCSGIRSIHLAIMAGVFWAAWHRLNLAWGVLLFVSAIVGALALNLVRVCFLAAGVSITAKLDFVDQWHDPAGLIGQLLLMVGVALFAGILPKRPAGKPEPSGVPDHLAAVKSIRTPTMPWWCVGALAGWLIVSESGVEFWFRRNEPTVCDRAYQSPMSVPHGLCSDCRVPGIWALKPLEGVVPWKRVEMPDAIREKYRYSTADFYSASEGGGVSRSMLWLNFARGTISSFTHNINLPQVCLPAHDYVLVKQFPDLVAQPAGAKFVLRHQLYRQRGRILHLFFSEMQSSDTNEKAAGFDGSPAARIDLARNGIRSQTASIFHILIEADTSKMPPVEVVRQSVTNSVQDLVFLQQDPSLDIECCKECGGKNDTPR